MQTLRRHSDKSGGPQELDRLQQRRGLRACAPTSNTKSFLIHQLQQIRLNTTRRHIQLMHGPIHSTYIHTCIYVLHSPYELPFRLMVNMGYGQSSSRSPEEMESVSNRMSWAKGALWASSGSVRAELSSPFESTNQHFFLNRSTAQQSTAVMTWYTQVGGGARSPGLFYRAARLLLDRRGNLQRT